MASRLGIYCRGTGSGGPWRYVHSILAAIDPDEFDVSLFCDIPGDYEPNPAVKVVRFGTSRVMPEQPSSAGSPPRRSMRSKVARIAPAGLRLWAGLGQEARALARVFQSHPVDILHTQHTGCEESPLAARLAGIKSVLGTFHVDSTYDLQHVRNGPSHRLVEVVSNRCLSAAIAVSEETKRDWVRRTRMNANRVLTIHNGIDPDKFSRRRCREEARRMLGIAEDALVIGGLGRLDEAKGFVYLIDAAAQLRTAFPDLVVAIAGAGPLRTPLEEQVAKLGLTDCVRFLGFQSDVQIVLDALDVFAMPSLCEALPYALLEAMATELPVVGASVGGVPEVVVENETGFIVPARNPFDLANRLRVLLSDGELRNRMGIAGRSRVVKHFHERDMVQSTLNVYRTAVRK